jgi:uncharacterized membrane protein YfcA
MAMMLMTVAILLLSFYCIAVMIYKLKQQPSVSLSTMDYCKLMGSGVVAFISDALGMGSFAVNIALAELLGTFHDDELPAMNNGAQVIPGMIESLFFMQLVDVDLVTLVTLVVGTCLGGVMGGSVVSRLSKQAIRLAMMGCFTLILFLLVCKQSHFFPIGGELIALHTWKLGLGFLGMVLCGMLTSVGIGLFVMVQTVLFLLGVSPMVAFPIMTVAGAMQQPLTTLAFLRHDKIPLKKTLILSLSGCVGVVFALFIFHHLTITWLHSLLMLIVAYNLFAVSRTYIRTKGESSSLDGATGVTSLVYRPNEV